MQKSSRWVDISEIISEYLPISKKKARKLVLTYMNYKRIGNRLYVNRQELEDLLSRTDITSLPLE